MERDFLNEFLFRLRRCHAVPRPCLCDGLIAAHTFVQTVIPSAVYVQAREGFLACGQSDDFMVQNHLRTVQYQKTIVVLVQQLAKKLERCGGALHVEVTPVTHDVRRACTLLEILPACMGPTVLLHA